MRQKLLLLATLCLIGLSALAGWYCRGFVLPAPAIPVLAELPSEALSDVDSFIAALADLPQPVSEARLAQFVAAFQLRQDALYPPERTDGAGFIDPAEGHVTLTLDATGPYHELRIMRVEETHTALIGIDGGVDGYRIVILDKASLRPLADLPGPVHAFGNPALRLSLPARTSCAGLVPTGALEVFDVQTGRSIFSSGLASGTRSASEPDFVGAESVRFTTYREEYFEDGTAHYCEAGHWVRKFDTYFDLTCDKARGTCSLEEVSVEIPAGCSEIGHCI